MIKLHVNPKQYTSMLERLLVPRRIWKGGWYVSFWNSRRQRWVPAFNIYDLNCGPFLKHQKKRARAQLAFFQKLLPRCRFRLQPIGAAWLLNFYDGLVWCPDDPDRKWFEAWGGGSPLWRLLGRQPA